MNGDGGVEMPLNLKDFLAVASDEYLRAILLRGREGTPMPSIEALVLRETDADELVAYFHQRRPAGEC